MTEPRILPEEIVHTIPLRTTSLDLRRLAEIAEAHDLARVHEPFATFNIQNGVELRFFLDHDEELMARGKRLHRGDTEDAEDGKGDAR